MKDSGEQVRDGEGQRGGAASAEAKSLPEIRAAVDAEFERAMAAYTNTMQAEFERNYPFVRAPCRALTVAPVDGVAIIERELATTLERYLDEPICEGNAALRCTLMDRPAANIAFFGPDRLHGALEFHLADALRELALALDSGTITARLEGFAGDTVPGSPDRVRFQIRLMVDAPIRSEVR